MILPSYRPPFFTLYHLHWITLPFLPSLLAAPYITCAELSFLSLPPSPTFPFLPLLARLPRTHGVGVGPVLPKKTSDSCCVCLCAPVCFMLSLHPGLSPYVGPHLLAGRIMSYKPLLKLDLFTLPLCTWRQQKQYDLSFDGPTTSPHERNPQGSQKISPLWAVRSVLLLLLVFL